MGGAPKGQQPSIDIDEADFWMDPDCPWGLDDDLRLAREVTREAGRIALGYFRRNELRQWDKGRDGPVTEADFAVDNFLRTTLLQNRPGYGWLSEETEDQPERLKCGRLWVVDPIDGTRSFVAGGENWAISVALIEKAKPVIAALYAPVQNALYIAAHGRGASKNGTDIQVSATADIDAAHMAGSGPAFLAHEYWPVPWPETMRCTEMNSIALRLAHVADGQADCCVTLRPKNDWDVAAADLLVREAGGQLTTGKGERLLFNRKRPLHAHIMASNDHLMPELEGRVTPALEAWEERQRRAPI